MPASVPAAFSPSFESLKRTDCTNYSYSHLHVWYSPLAFFFLPIIIFLFLFLPLPLLAALSRFSLSSFLIHLISCQGFFIVLSLVAATYVAVFCIFLWRSGLLRVAIQVSFYFSHSLQCSCCSTTEEPPLCRGVSTTPVCLVFTGPLFFIPPSYILNTMTQARLNHLMVLIFHRDLTDGWIWKL